MNRLLLLPVFATALCAAQISTGVMLGRHYDQRAFYVRESPEDDWQKTYSAPIYRHEAQGKLMNIRLANALFLDEWLKERPFDPEFNTDSVIHALDFYKSHGVLMINVSLQGAPPGYDRAVNGIERENAFRLGPGRGTSVSAFGPDGSLKPDWMARLARLLRATNDRGMFVNLMYFFHGQDQQFRSTDAIHAAARNITNWLVAHDIRNVIIDVANEYDLPLWNFKGYIPQNIIPLIDDVRECFKHAGYALPVGVSSDGRMRYPRSLEGQVDVLLVHGDGRDPEEKARRVAELKDFDRPVLMTEDDNGRTTTREHLAGDLASCDVFFRHAAGWGYLPWIQAQRFPFRYLPAGGAEVRDDMPPPERDMAYFHAVLDHIAALTLRHPPQEDGL
ncbi:MAG TPA: hypothetical protein VMI94_16535 [Bryobacteraceae bacterium]|nr:hypothetical protein [Bryobacteraceae bacterium]